VAIKCYYIYLFIQGGRLALVSDVAGHFDGGERERAAEETAAEEVAAGRDAAAGVLGVRRMRLLERFSLLLGGRKLPFWRTTRSRSSSSSLPMPSDQGVTPARES